MRRRNGFTLIELLIVVTIVGIISAIAIPAYSGYMMRARVSEGLATSAPVKLEVAQEYGKNQQWPDGFAALGFTAAPSSKYVSSIDVDTGTIVITFSPEAGSAVSLPGQNVLTMRPGFATGTSGVIMWNCGYQVRATVYADKSGVDSSAVPTTVPARYLPMDCR